ncbi:MAG: peptidase S51 [Clostridia bacterium]|nr:peptidase S51 [Clostridia bacterium]
MINVLLNYYNFDGEWAYPHLKEIVPNNKVLIIPLAFRESQAWDNESWLSVYGKNGEKYDNIIRPFLAYGYTEADIDWLNCYDKRNHAEQVQNATLLFFTGGMPEKAVARMEQLGITNAVKHFDGIIMGASAGAMLQLDVYHITPDDDYDHYEICRGLSLVKGFDLEVHYLATDLQKSCSMRAVSELNLPVYQMWHEGGIIVDDGKITVMGNVEIKNA